MKRNYKKRNNPVSEALDRGFSLDKISLITGYSKSILKMLRRGEIKNHITHHKGVAVPSLTVLVAHFYESMNEYISKRNKLWK